MAAHLSYPTGSSSLRWVLTSFVLPVHNRGASLAIYQGQALWRRFLPAASSFFVLSLLIQTLLLQHLSVDASCNHYGCFILWNYAAFSCVPGRLISPSIFDLFLFRLLLSNGIADLIQPCLRRSNRSASPSYLAWYSVWSRATWAFSLTHCCISSATTFSSS